MHNAAFVTAMPALRGNMSMKPQVISARRLSLVQSRRHTTSICMKSPADNDAPTPSTQDLSFVLLGLASVLPAPANAVPEVLVETFKSIPVSLAHPTVMWLLLGTTIYTFYLGYQSRQIRTSPPEKRRTLVKERFPDRHFQTSSAIFATMTIATFTGMANTYTRTGKLFPGPHLYTGLGLVALMSVMSSMVPYMQKGKDWARNTHFTLAFLVLGLFGWQAKSGMDIVAKLLGWK